MARKRKKSEKWVERVMVLVMDSVVKNRKHMQSTAGGIVAAAVALASVALG